MHKRRSSGSGRKRYRFRTKCVDLCLVPNVFKHEQVLTMDVSQEERADQRLQKEAQVTLYRNYRVGDFPDIQISYSSLITPLQALSQVGLLPLHCRCQ